MTEEQIESLRKKLTETLGFPAVYMYKFIIESENRKIALLESIFDADAEIHTKESSNGKYTSITAKTVVVDVEEIILVYKKASEIKGVIFL